jgi:hypothetical protein
MCLEVFTRRLKVVEGRFRLDELQMHQAAGGIVDIDKQGALRAAVLEPPVLGAVDLHELTQAIAPSAGLMDALQPVLPPNPNTGADHPLPQRLDAEIQAVPPNNLPGENRQTVGRIGEVRLGCLQRLRCPWEKANTPQKCPEYPLKRHCGDDFGGIAATACPTDLPAAHASSASILK